VTAAVIESASGAERPRWLRWLLRALFAMTAAAILATPWWGPRTVSHLDYFRVRQVTFEGVRYADTRALVTRMALDSTSSIWNDLDAFAARVTGDPMVLSADVTRRMPATVVVKIVERVPVALAPSRGAMSALDAEGHALPIDPARVVIDAPIIATADTTILRFLDGLRLEAPALYARVIEVRRVNKSDLWMQLKGIVVRTRDDVTVGRLQDILRVEAALKQQNQRVAELDLRFQDQVIARLP
jgi:cell division protein FtsQ